MRSNQGDNLNLNQTIIENYRSTQSVRPDYLAYLTQKSMAYSNRARETELAAEQAQIAIDQSMVALIDRIFGMLEPYLQEMNRINRVAEMHLSFVAPGRSNEAIELDRSRKPSKITSFYRCRISTGKLSLVIRGLQGRVEFFIIQADRVMGLSNEEACHQPLMIFEAEISNNGLTWMVEGKQLTSDRFERFTLLILEHLLDLSQEELNRGCA